MQQKKMVEKIVESRVLSGRWAAILHGMPVEAPMTSNMLETVMPHGRRAKYRAKSTIVRTGEIPTSLYFIVKGSVSVMMEGEEGRELILAYLGPGEIFGELGLFDAEPRRSACVRTRTDCEVVIVEYRIFRELCRKNAELLMHLTGRIAARLCATSRRMGNLAFLDVTGRIARALLELVHDSQAITHPDGMLLRITREELGRIANCTREMASRVLQDLQSQGLIDVEGRSIVVYGTRQRAVESAMGAAWASRSVAR